MKSWHHSKLGQIQKFTWGGDFAFHSPSCFALLPPQELMHVVKIIERRDSCLFISGLFISAFHHDEILARKNCGGHVALCIHQDSPMKPKVANQTTGEKDFINSAYYFLQELPIIIKHLLPHHHILKPKFNCRQNYA